MLVNWLSDQFKDSAQSVRFSTFIYTLQNFPVFSDENFFEWKKITNEEYVNFVLNFNFFADMESPHMDPAMVMVMS